MQFARAAVFVILPAKAYSVDEWTNGNPVTKVIGVLGKLEAKIVKDGKDEEVAYGRYMEWCQSGGQEKEFEIKTAKADIEDLTATIGKTKSDIDVSAQKIEDLSGEISSTEADLKEQTGIRKKEKDEFVKTERELVDTIDTLERATNILERKMRGSALLEAKIDKTDLTSLVNTLSQVVDAAGLALHDKKKLMALAQSDAEDDEAFDDEALGAPDPAAYESRSGSIVDILEDLKTKAETQLSDLRRQEANGQHNFDMMKQSLTDQMSADSKELDDAKQLKSSSTETKAQAQGELDVTQKDLANGKECLKNMGEDCKMVARDHEMSVKTRQEELRALATAKQALVEMTGGASKGSYSFLQVGAESVNIRVVSIIRKLSHKERSQALAQLAGRISSAIKAATVSGEDPFAKVKTLISDMIVRLEKAGKDEDSHKAYCDKEWAATKKKTSELKFNIEKSSGKIDKSKSEAARLKDDVAELQREIAEITKGQAEADVLRQDENKKFKAFKVDLEQGLEGVRVALKVLRDYYANDSGSLLQRPSHHGSLLQQPVTPESHGKSEGAGGGVIAMLEVVESDFGKNLAAIQMEEDTAAMEYQKWTQENKVSKVMKEQDVKYKTKEGATLAKAITEMVSDLGSAETELDAVLDYTSQIRGMCETKPDTYADRRERREAEIDGLKAAMSALEGEAPAELLQQKGPQHLRGAAVAPHAH